MMTSRLLALHITILLAVACVIGLYVIYALGVIGLRHITLTAWESRVNFTTDVRCPGSDVVPNETLVVLNYDGIAVAGPDSTVTVNVQRPTCTRQRTCVFTSDKQLFNRSDAVIFSDMQQSHHFPTYRPPQQKWVLRTMETPVNAALSFAKRQRLIQQRHYYNVTSTYALFSDIPTPYFVGRCHDAGVDDSRMTPVSDRLQSKDRAVAWFASHCWTSSKRERYVSELQRFIDVDVYGVCGRLRCPTSAAELCLEMLERRYFFYLAFENSLCVDYVTEKYWRTLRRDVVSVVLGAANYTHFVPPGIHLDVRDFTSPRHLADRLRALMTDDVDAYVAMLNRKRRLRCTSDNEDDDSELFQTRLCRYLDATEGKTRRTDLEVSWNARSMCRTPRNFYRGIADMVAY